MLLTTVYHSKGKSVSYFMKKPLFSKTKGAVKAIKYMKTTMMTTCF